MLLTICARRLLHQTLLDNPPKVALCRLAVLVSLSYLGSGIPFQALVLCRCDKHRIPLLRDLEFDEFLNSHVPSEQLVVVCVTSSR